LSSDSGKVLGSDSGKELSTISGKNSGNTLGYDSDSYSGKVLGSDSGKESGTISGKNPGKRACKKSGKELPDRVKTRVKRSSKTKMCKTRRLHCFG
jgi:hypothetical protein